MANLKYTPFADQILILPEEEKPVTESGIIAPSGVGDQPKIALVVAVGSGKYCEYPIPAQNPNSGLAGGSSVLFAKIPVDVKVGDRILYKGWGTNSIKIDGKEHFLLKQEDILSIVEEETSDKN